MTQEVLFLLSEKARRLSGRARAGARRGAPGWLAPAARGGARSGKEKLSPSRASALRQQGASTRAPGPEAAPGPPGPRPRAGPAGRSGRSQRVTCSQSHSCLLPTSGGPRQSKWLERRAGARRRARASLARPPPRLPRRASKPAASTTTLLLALAAKSWLKRTQSEGCPRLRLAATALAQRSVTRRKRKCVNIHLRRMGIHDSPARVHSSSKRNNGAIVCIYSHEISETVSLVL